MFLDDWQSQALYYAISVSHAHIFGQIYIGLIVLLCSVTILYIGRVICSNTLCISHMIKRICLNTLKYQSSEDKTDTLIVNAYLKLMCCYYCVWWVICIDPLNRVFIKICRDYFFLHFSWSCYKDSRLCDSAGQISYDPHDVPTALLWIVPNYGSYLFTKN